MKGTILEPGLISGADDKRYTYDAADVRTPDIAAAAGMQADFTPLEGGRAGEIYLTPSAKSVAAEVFSSAGGVGSLRTRAIIAIICGWLSWVPVLGIVFLIVSLVLWVLVFGHVKRETSIGGFIPLIIGGIVLAIVGSVIGAAGIVAALGSSSSGAAAAFGTMGVAGIIIALASGICYCAVDFKLARASGVGLFKAAGICRLFTVIPFVGIVAAVLDVIAWCKTEQLIPAVEGNSAPAGGAGGAGGAEGSAQ